MNHPPISSCFLRKKLLFCKKFEFVEYRTSNARIAIHGAVITLLQFSEPKNEEK